MYEAALTRRRMYIDVRCTLTKARQGRSGKFAVAMSYCYDGVAKHTRFFFSAGRVMEIPVLNSTLAACDFLLLLRNHDNQWHGIAFDSGSVDFTLRPCMRLMAF